jgi:hypothetical protein
MNNSSSNFESQNSAFNSNQSLFSQQIIKKNHNGANGEFGNGGKPQKNFGGLPGGNNRNIFDKDTFNCMCE